MTTSDDIGEYGGAYRAYHGSPRDFTRFKRSRGGFGGAIGLWFASTRAAAAYFAQDRYAGERPVIFTVDLILITPKVFQGHAELVEAVRAKMRGGSIEDGYRALRRALVRTGHDSIIVKDSDTDSGLVRDDYVVFDPSQVQIVRKEYA